MSKIRPNNRKPHICKLNGAWVVLELGKCNYWGADLRRAVEFIKRLNGDYSIAGKGR